MVGPGERRAPPCAAARRHATMTRLHGRGRWFPAPAATQGFSPCPWLRRPPRTERWHKHKTIFPSNTYVSAPMLAFGNASSRTLRQPCSNKHPSQATCPPHAGGVLPASLPQCLGHAGGHCAEPPSAQVQALMETGFLPNWQAAVPPRWWHTTTT